MNILPITMINEINSVLPQAKEMASKKETLPERKRYPIFVALERGLNVSIEANIQLTVIESQI